MLETKSADTFSILKRSTSASKVLMLMISGSVAILHLDNEFGDSLSGGLPSSALLRTSHRDTFNNVGLHATTSQGRVGFYEIGIELGEGFGGDCLALRGRNHRLWTP